MRIAVAKPDYGIAGGFEIVLGRIEQDLLAEGHQVDWLTVEVATLGRSPFGVDVPTHVWDQCPEFFNYMRLVEAFRQIDADGYDILVSTQPPSFVIEHPRHLALFYHHHRVFYDLSDVYLAAGFAERSVHERAQRAIRQIDGSAISRVTHFLAASEVVKERLRAYHGLSENVGVFHAGSGLPDELLGAAGTGRFEHPLCVSRHEFPKRTELFVHAMKFLPRQTGVMVGGGGRQAWVRSLDAALSSPGVDLDAWGDEELWLRRPGPIADEVGASNVRFAGHVSNSELGELYGSALCVVAPAYLEDYGLTAIEAMAVGKPVIVCKDGGGLTELVEDGVTGFVVEPSGRAIAEAVRTFADDPELAREMGTRGREIGRQYGWDHAMEEIREGLERVGG